VGQGGAGDPGDSDPVDLEHAMPLVAGVGLDRALCAHAGAADENVESPEATDDLFNGRLDGHRRQ
jgi:hypothetical protein